VTGQFICGTVFFYSLVKLPDTLFV